MQKKVVLAKLKKFERAFMPFQELLFKAIKDLIDGDTVPSAGKLSRLCISLNAKYIAMPKAFRVRLNKLGFERLLTAVDDAAAQSLVLDARSDMPAYGGAVRGTGGEIRILEAIAMDNEIDSYLEQFD